MENIFEYLSVLKQNPDITDTEIYAYKYSHNIANKLLTLSKDNQLAYGKMIVNTLYHLDFFITVEEFENIGGVDGLIANLSEGTEIGSKFIFLILISDFFQNCNIDLSEIEPTVSFPHLPENTHVVGSFDDIKIDQVVIGSCTNGRIDDLRCAAKILEGRKVAKGLRVIVIPATQKIYMQAIEEGLVQTFIRAGAVVSTPTCGPCLGGYMGILAEGERCVSTTNRNFVGRMGHVDSEIYLASPAVAAASAVTGKISQPSDLGL